MSTLTWMTEKELQSQTKLLEKVFPIMSTFIPTKLFPKARHLCGKKSPSPSSMLLPTNAQGTGFLLNTQQHCFQRKGEREQPIQLRYLEKCSPSIQFQFLNSFVQVKIVEREIKTKEDQFRWKKNKNFVAVVRKRDC